MTTHVHVYAYTMTEHERIYVNCIIIFQFQCVYMYH